MKTSSVLVTGGAGYIGSHVALALRDSGRGVVVLDNLSVGHRDLVPGGVPLIVADVGDTAAVADALETHGCRSVVHLAGSVLVNESLSRPAAYYRNNVSATVGLLDACVAAAVERLVFSSSASVYGIAESVPIPEDAPLQPVHPYGRSKLMAESIITDVAAATGLGCALLRYFNVAGADPAGRSGQCRPEATHLIHVIAEVVAGKRPELGLYGTDYPTPDGTCVRDYIHVSDLAMAHVAALDRIEPGAAPLVLNLGDGSGHSVREVVAATEAITGKILPVVEAGRRAGDPPALVADTARARALLDWMPRENALEAMLRSAIDWEQSGTHREGGNVERPD